MTQAPPPMRTVLAQPIRLLAANAELQSTIPTI
jgi:hypothetical protein